MSRILLHRILLISLGIWMLSSAAFAQHGWTTVYQGPQSFCGIHFQSPLIGWVTSLDITDHFSLWKTTDSGETWIGVIPSSQFNGWYIVFYDDQRAFMPFGWYAAYTEDGFAHWNYVGWNVNSDTTINQVVYLDSTTLIGISSYLSGDDEATNQIRTSSDGGRTWNRQVHEVSPSTHFTFDRICLSANGTALVSDRPNSVKRGINRGQTWTQIDNLPIGNIYAISSSAMEVFYVAGSSNDNFYNGYPVIVRSLDDGMHWQIVWSDSSLLPFHVSLWSISFPDSLHGWIMGDSGLTVQTCDGGTTWESYFLDSCRSGISCSSFLDSTLGWAVDISIEHARIYRYGTPQFSLEKPATQIPAEMEILSIYPNPFNFTTSIEYSVPKPCLVMVKLWDITGREVATLFEGEANPGRHEIQWNAQTFSSGIYFCQIQSGSSYSEMKKLLLIK